MIYASSLPIHSSVVKLSGKFSHNMPFEVTHDFQLPNSNFYHKYSPFCVALSVLLFAYAISTPPKHELLKSFLLSSRLYVMVT